MKQQADYPVAQQRQTHSAAQRETATASAPAGMHDTHNTQDTRASALAQRSRADMVARSPMLAAQRALSAQVNGSPRMAAQRKRLESPSGGASQRRQDTHAQPLPAAPAANRTGLPGQLKAGIEALSGFSMSDVRVHYNSSQPAQMQAHAYAQGSDIYMAPGQQQHLAHEAWHVVQQKQGRVRPTMNVQGKAVNDNRGLEAEADAMGAKAAQFKPAGAARPLQLKSVAPQPVAQRVTALIFGTNVPANQQIQTVNHNRNGGGVNGPAANWVLANGEVSAVPGGTVCNHSRSYQSIAAGVTALMANQTVAQAATNVSNAYAALQANLTNPPGGHQGVLNTAIGGGVTQLGPLQAALDYYTYKIADYPRNLFYWPNRTGGNPDAPQTVYTAPPTAPVPPAQALPAVWAFRNPGTADATRLGNEVARVGAGQGDLTAAGV